MKLSLGERGEINTLLIPLILSTIFFFGSLGFGVWAYMERGHYKDDTDAIVAGAVESAVEKAKSEKDNEFIEREKNPYRDYQGPASLGSIQFKYPKTWSGSFKESNTELQVTMHPALVPLNEKTSYALKVEVVNQAYDRVATSMESSVKNGKLTANPFRLDKLDSVVGTRFDGELRTEKQGSVVILPMRDKTLRITTESQDFVGDFNNIILKNFTFSP
jgi:hypothetical protein